MDIGSKIRNTRKEKGLSQVEVAQAAKIAVNSLRLYESNKRQLRNEQAMKSISIFVFTREHSPEPMHPQSPTRYLKKFSERHGIPDLHPHKLRHTFASVAITSGADVASVSEALGHSDKAVTLRMYTHANEESVNKASQIFRSAIKKAGQG